MYGARKAKVFRDLSSYCEESESVRSVPRMDIRQELSKGTLSAAPSFMSTVPELPSLSAAPRPVGYVHPRRFGGPPQPIFDWVPDLAGHENSFFLHAMHVNSLACRQEL